MGFFTHHGEEARRGQGDLAFPYTDKDKSKHIAREDELKAMKLTNKELVAARCLASAIRRFRSCVRKSFEQGISRRNNGTGDRKTASDLVDAYTDDPRLQQRLLTAAGLLAGDRSQRSQWAKNRRQLTSS